ncbi:hypothetical protein N7931_00520 [Catenovulum sp. 2E275]|uniref:DUF4886 domain-containing protein n=1 Tax=Catenovulum sp. 2E275 TaxID=2980497 RepID=UPI0021CE36FC|nr:DUF4886 domain-containing protein [Catenovulum sp. 2E275]MCU4674104.1 hypothetical protein [Catenovulum sp. 2E275]
MKLIQLLIFTLLLSWQTITLAGQNKQVLFIGNSYTFTYDVPGLTAKLAQYNGDKLIFDSSLLGGYQLSQHLEYQVTLQKVAKQQWDHIVLQEFSTKAFNNYLGFEQSVILFDSLFKQHNAVKPEQVILYMTWGRQNTQLHPKYPYNLHQQATIDAYNKVAKKLNMQVAPVGLAWRAVREDGDKINLYDADGTHQSFAGGYLAACVFYATIFNKSPVGIAFYGELDKKQALYLQQQAWLAVQSQS